MNIKCFFRMHAWDIITPWKRRACSRCGTYQEYVITNSGMTKTWITLSNNWNIRFD